MAPVAMGEEKKDACPERPADKAIARDLAGDYFVSAERSFKKELFDDALAKFLCSLRLVEHENTVFNIAHVTNFVTDKEAALHLFYAYVEDYPDGEITEEINEIIIELEEMLGKDGSVRQYPPSDSASGMEDASGEKAASDVAKEGIKMSRVVDIATWTGFGVGGASLIVAVILQGVSASAKKQAENATTYNDFVDAKEKHDSLQTGAIVMFVSAGIFGAAGAALMLWDKGLLEGKKKNEVTLSLVPLPSGVVLEGRF
jgi:hypothetical protein